MPIRSLWTFIVMIPLLLSGTDSVTGRFESRPSNLISDYENTLSEDHGSPAPSFVDNSGVYVSDVNNNLRPDVLLTGGEHPVLLKNEEGAFEVQKRFSDLSYKVAYAHFVDVNADGWKDLILVPRKGFIRVYRNHEGRFPEPRTLEAPRLKEGIGATSGDFNQDGCADLFVIQYNDTKKLNFRQLQRKRMGLQKDRNGDNGRKNFLLTGDCETFKLTQNSQFGRKHWSLATSMADLNDDGYPEIHVANDFYRDSLYVNRGILGYEHRYLDQSTNRNGMSSEILSMIPNGLLDIFVSNIYLGSRNVWKKESFFNRYAIFPEGHNLLVNQGNLRFDDRADTYNVKKGGWGWAVSFGDFDNDFSVEAVQLRQNFLRINQFMNDLRLSKTSFARFIGKYSGNTPYPLQQDTNEVFRKFRPWMGYPQYWDWNVSSNRFTVIPPDESGFGRIDGRAVSQLDFDNDGDLDLIFTQHNGPYRLLENTTHKEGDPWFKVKTKQSFVGGSLYVRTSSDTRELPINTRSDFLSQEPSFFHISGFDSPKEVSLRVDWNSGEILDVDRIQPGRVLVVTPTSYRWESPLLE